ncbi:hypothetical protein DFH09DRAFT_1282543 [Mycena vulgaris]|nr:hypothetical protein DFH09DRAFT_1282543 [Mycena vulgaris]
MYLRNKETNSHTPQAVHARATPAPPACPHLALAEYGTWRLPTRARPTTRAALPFVPVPPSAACASSAARARNVPTVPRAAPASFVALAPPRSPVSLVRAARHAGLASFAPPAPPTPRSDDEDSRVIVSVRMSVVSTSEEGDKDERLAPRTAVKVKARNLRRGARAAQQQQTDMMLMRPRRVRNSMDLRWRWWRWRTARQLLPVARGSEGSPLDKRHVRPPAVVAPRMSRTRAAVFGWRAGGCGVGCGCIGAVQGGGESAVGVEKGRRGRGCTLAEMIKEMEGDAPTFPSHGQPRLAQGRQDARRLRRLPRRRTSNQPEDVAEEVDGEEDVDEEDSADVREARWDGRCIGVDRLFVAAGRGVVLVVVMGDMISDSGSSIAGWCTREDEVALDLRESKESSDGRISTGTPP